MKIGRGKITALFWVVCISLSAFVMVSIVPINADENINVDLAIGYVATYMEPPTDDSIYNLRSDTAHPFYLGDDNAELQIRIVNRDGGVGITDVDVTLELIDPIIVDLPQNRDPGAPYNIGPGGSKDFVFLLDIAEMGTPGYYYLQFDIDYTKAAIPYSEDNFPIQIYISSIFEDRFSPDTHEDLPDIEETDATPEFEEGMCIQEGEIRLINYAGFMISDVEGTLTNIPSMIIPTNGNNTAEYPGPIGGVPFELYWNFDIEPDIPPGHYPFELDFTYNRSDTGLIITEYPRYTGLNVAPSTKTTGPIDGPTNEAEINITYSMTGTPPDVDLYYTTNTSAPYSWVFIDSDSSPDGYYDWTIPADGSYSWFAISENETAPNSSTPPEASFYIYDGTPPEVDNTDPADTEDNVAMESDIILTFDEAMNTTSLSYAIEPDPGGLSVVWGASNMSATISHLDFLSGSRYWVNITAGKDLAGNNLDTLPYSFYFDTIDISSTATATGPIGGPTNISVITISYTTTNNPAGVELFYTMNTSSPYQWILIETDRPPDGSYMFTLPDDGSYGWNAVATDESPPISTDAPEAGFYVYDGTRPEITDIEPDDGAIEIALVYHIVISFDEKMNESSLQCTLRPNPGMYFILWNEEGDNVTLSHESFEPNTRYWVNITSGMDMAGNNLDSLPYSFYFDTIILDITPPSVVSTAPFGINVDITSDIVITFSEAMNTDSVENAFSFTDDTTTWNISDGVVTWDAVNETMIFTPSFNLNYNTTYNVTLGSTAQDMAGNYLTIHMWDFTVMPEPDTTAPSVDMAIYSRDEIDKTYSISFIFNEPMNHSSVQGALVVSPDVTVLYMWMGDNTLKITTVSDLKPGTEYEFTIRTGATDEAGNTLSEPYTLIIKTEVKSEDDSSTFWMLLILIIVVIMIILLILIRKRGKGERSPGETTGEESTLENGDETSKEEGQDREGSSE